MNKKSVFFQHLCTFFCILSLIMSFCASAQNLKPVKDKATKKYGYKSKGDKAWIIGPEYDRAWHFSGGYAEVQVGEYIGLINTYGEFIFPPEYSKISKFDKNGFCELTKRVNGVKLHGIADMDGRIRIPVECRSVRADRHGLFLFAKYDTEIPGFKPEQLWGIYDTEGRQVFAPQFSSLPSFTNGTCIIRKGSSGKYGVIGADGTILMPFNYLAISRYSGGFKALGTDFSLTTLTPDLRSSQTIRHPGAVFPYDPKDDIIRAAAWHKGPVGIRLHRNGVKLANLHMAYSSVQAICTDLPIDWGYGRFVRLEPCAVPPGSPNSMYYGTGHSSYTLKAILYEEDGSYVRELCSEGWIEANFSEGAIYNAGGHSRWVILADPNAIGVPAYTMDIHDYKPVNHTEVFSGLGISVAEVSNLLNLYNFTSRCREIYEGENIGLNSYTPRVPTASQTRAERAVNRSPIFRYPFHMGEVVNCKVLRKGGIPKLELSDELVCFYKDRVDDPYFTFSGGEELIYWGPNNARTVVMSLEAVPNSGNLQDDVYKTGFSYIIALNMYEEDGRWLRTLATAPFIDFIQDGIIVFEGLGIALIGPRTGIAPGAGRPLPQKQGHVVINRNGQAPRNPVTTNGGARNSTAVTPSAKPADMQPVAHTISALEAAFPAYR